MKVDYWNKVTASPQKNEVGTLFFRLQESGKRYDIRQPPLFMIRNMWEGKCWCGKPKSQFEKHMRKYCCNKHSSIWYYSIRSFWDSFRLERIRIDKFTCVECGFSTRTTDLILNDEDEPRVRGSDSEFQVDHIIAIVNGGDCFDIENVRTLCVNCHKVKTANDIRKKFVRKKAEKFIGLDNFIDNFTKS